MTGLDTVELVLRDNWGFPSAENVGLNHAQLLANLMMVLLPIKAKELVILLRYIAPCKNLSFLFEISF